MARRHQDAKQEIERALAEQAEVNEDEWAYIADVLGYHDDLDWVDPRDEWEPELGREFW